MPDSDFNGSLGRIVAESTQWKDPGLGMKLLFEHACSGNGAPSGMCGCSCRAERPGRPSLIPVCKELFPMFVLPIAEVMKLDTLRPFQELLARGCLLKYTETMLARVIFVSHQWLGWSHPDPERIQLSSLQACLCRLMKGGTDTHPHFAARLAGVKTAVKGRHWARVLPHMLCWVDYCCMPQPTAAGEVGDHRYSCGDLAKQLSDAVQSIPAYIERTALIIILVPLATHANTGATCGVSSWRSRGWCRMEFLSAALARYPIPTMVCGTRPAHFILPGDLQSLTAGQGQFTCCLLQHRMAGTREPCDRGNVKHILEKLLDAKVEHLLQHRRLVEARLYIAGQRWALQGLDPLQIQEEAAKPSTEQLRSNEMPRPVADLKGKLRWGAEAEEMALESSTGFGLLHYAVYADDQPAVLALLAMRIDVNQRTLQRFPQAGFMYKGLTPLHVGMAWAGESVVRILLRMRGDPEVRLPFSLGITLGPIEVASNYGRADLLDAWFAHFPGVDLGWGLNWAARAGSLSAVHVLVRARADVNRQMENGAWAPLTFASGLSEDASEDVVEALLTARANVNIRNCPKGRYSAVCAAMRLACRAGMRSEACVVLANAKGSTPLHAATGFTPNPGIVRLLLGVRADPAAKTSFGLCPLQYAAALGGDAVLGALKEVFDEVATDLAETRSV